jgi:tetratricopeptide (TPR) repeat protein
LILVFIAAGVLRLNECDLFNPDSPRYLIYAQGLLETGEYRAVDVPGEPIYTWRPPGLPLLLAPVLYFKPYDVIAAKCVVLASAVLLLWMVHLLASSVSGGWSGPLAVTAVSSSPIFLVLSTEVLTEVPYALGTLAVICWMGRWCERRPSALFALVVIVLAFLPFVRTVAVSLVAAVAVWSLVSRRRWPMLLPVGVAILGLIWQAQRGDSSDNYAGQLQATLSEQGLLGVVREASGQLSYYAQATADVLLPGLTGVQPFYVRLMIEASPTLSGFESVALAAACAIVFLAAIGWWSARRQAGGLALLYLPLYFGCLALWPWRHERFVWVLVPLIWAFVPAGLSAATNALPPRVRSGWNVAAALCLLALCVWHLRADTELVAANQQFLSRGDTFYAEDQPSFYFSDFRAAGQWIRDHTPEHARILTWHAAIAGTAHRYQKRVSFETQTPERIRQQVEAFSARYLVVPTAQFHDGFGWQQISADPAIAWKIVYERRGVAVLEVQPNRDGVVTRTAYDDWLAVQLAAVEGYLQNYPQRSDLSVRRAGLLAELGRCDEAIVNLRELVDRGVVTVRVCADLGWLLLEQGEYAEAAKFLDRARGLPNSEAIADALANGARLAQEKARSGTDSPVREASGIERDLERLKHHVAMLKFAAAERIADRLTAAAPDYANVQYWRGYLHHVFGEWDEAAACYERAIHRGSTEARGKLRLMRWCEAMARGRPATIAIIGDSEAINPDCAAAHLELARQLDANGWSGRALAVLEAAHEQFDDSSLFVPMADLYRRFAQPERAVPLYRRALDVHPHDEGALRGLEAADEALRTPRFFETLFSRPLPRGRSEKARLPGSASWALRLARGHVGGREQWPAGDLFPVANVDHIGAAGAIETVELGEILLQTAELLVAGEFTRMLDVGLAAPEDARAAGSFQFERDVFGRGVGPRRGGHQNRFELQRIPARAEVARQIGRGEHRRIGPALARLRIGRGRDAAHGNQMGHAFGSEVGRRQEHAVTVDRIQPRLHEHHGDRLAIVHAHGDQRRILIANLDHPLDPWMLLKGVGQRLGQTGVEQRHRFRQPAASLHPLGEIGGNIARRRRVQLNLRERQPILRLLRQVGQLPGDPGHQHAQHRQKRERPDAMRLHGALPPRKGRSLRTSRRLSGRFRLTHRAPASLISCTLQVCGALSAAKEGPEEHIGSAGGAG